MQEPATHAKASKAAIVRPSILQKRQKRLLGIVSVARKLVLRHGHNQVSLRAIARESGLGPASLYEYFSGRDQILSAVQNQILSELADVLSKSQKDGPNLVALGMAYIGFARQNPSEYLLVFLHGHSKRRNLGEPLPPQTAYGILVATLGSFVRSAEALEEWAYGFWALVHGQAMLQITHLRDHSANFSRIDAKLIHSFQMALP